MKYIYSYKYLYMVTICNMLFSEGDEALWSFTCHLFWTFGSLPKCSHLKCFLYIGITLVDVYLNWLNWPHFLILRGDLVVILIDCMIFPSPFLDVTRMAMSTVSFLNNWILEFSAYRMLSFGLWSQCHSVLGNGGLHHHTTARKALIIVINERFFS